MEKSGTNYVFVVEQAGDGDTVRQVEVTVHDPIGTLRRIEAVTGQTTQRRHEDRRRWCRVPRRRPTRQRRRGSGGAAVSRSVLSVLMRLCGRELHAAHRTASRPVAPARPIPDSQP